MEKAKKPAAKAGETITISREEYERLLEENNALNRQLDWLMEQLRLMRIKKYGPSSEKRLLNDEELYEQLSLVFNEAEAYQPKEEKESGSQVSGYTRTKRSSRVEEILPEHVPVDVVEHRGRTDLPGLRGQYGRDRERSAAEAGDHPGAGQDTGGPILYLCLQEMYGRRYTDICSQDGERKPCDSRELCNG